MTTSTKCIPLLRASALLAALAALACEVDLSVPSTAQIRCGADEDCPAGRVCLLRTERCIDPVRLNDEAIRIVDARLDATRRSLVQGFDHDAVHFTLTAPAETLAVTLGEEPVACVEEVAAVEAEPDVPLSYVCSFFVPAGAKDGDVPVTVRATDDLGNVATEVLTVTFDVSAPQARADGGLDVRYAHAADNPRALEDAPVGAAVGTRITVSFLLSEPVAAMPTVRATGPLDLPLSPTQILEDGEVAVAFSYAMLVQDFVASGVYDVEITAVDDVGNAGTVLFENQVNVDVDPPANLDTSVPGLATYLRAPWGTDGGAPSFAVLVDGRAVEHNADIELYDGAVRVGAGTRGEDTTRDGVGDYLVVVNPPSDRTKIQVGVVDAVGNRSAAPRPSVAQVAWRATLGGKVPGSTFENPHVLRSTSRFVSLASPDLVEDLSSPLAFGATGVLDKSFRHRWRELGDGVLQPLPRSEAVLVWDALRGAPVVAGGASLGSPDRRSWTLREGEWRDLGVAPVRHGGCAAWDVRRGRVVVFGGIDETGAPSGTVLELEGDAFRQRLLPVDSGPGPRLHPACAWDENRGGVVVVGGQLGSVPSDEAWLLDGAGWHPLTVADVGAPPPARSGASMARVDGVGLVLFGGIGEGGLLADTWVLDDAGFRLLEIAGASPSARAHAAMATDPAGGAWLFGGNRAVDPDLVVDDELWHTDGAGWSLVTPATPGPPARAAHGLVTDPDSGALIVMGGLSGAFTGNGPDRHGDTWRYDPRTSTWTEIARRGQSPPNVMRLAAATAADGSIVTFSGTSQAANVFGAPVISADTRVLADRWSLFQPVAIPPPHEAGQRMARRGDDVIFVDTLGKPWRFTPSSWEELPAAGPRTGVVFGTAGLLYVAAVGNDLNAPGETWSFDGATWTLVDTAGPGPSRNVVAATGAGGEVLLWRPHDDTTWLFDPASQTWQVLTDVGNPHLDEAGLAFDAHRGTFLMFGGTNGGTERDDTWEFDGTRWQLLDVVERPPPMFGHAMVTSADGAVVSMGGFVRGIGTPGGKAWTFDDTAARPAFVLDVALGASGRSPGSVLRGVDATVFAAGEGGLGEGMEVLLWTGESFTALVENEPDAGVRTFTWSLDDPRLLRRVVEGPGETLHVLMRPSTGGEVGGEPARLFLDSVEVVVRYDEPPED